MFAIFSPRFVILGLLCQCISVPLPADEAEQIAGLHLLEELLIQSNHKSETNARNLLTPETYDSLLAKIERFRGQIQAARMSNDAALEIEFKITSQTRGQIVFGFQDRDLLVKYRFTNTKPIQVTSLDLEVVKLEPLDTTPLDWDSVDAAMQAATADGFSGAVLLSRNGKIVLNKGYGLANREQKINATNETVFAIGSAPIDFTHAGILLLKDRGKLTLDDPITKYFNNVPNDKQTITIRFLMNGRSGLPDFHELPGDENADHSWIDRTEAVRRIMNQKLLFEPGQSRRHSHSAWGLLAVIIELVSEQSYQEFTRQQLFKPAGMTDTGFGDPVPEDRIAVGYGMRSSRPNSPPHWGKTSWLVMGSGGQVSTLIDMYRWEVAMRNGAILSEDSQANYLKSSNGVNQDGDSFGFEFMHSKDPEQLFMIISNSINTREDRRKFDQLGKRLHKLIESGN